MDEATEDLKPCPFCGCTATVVGNIFKVASCKTLGCRGYASQNSMNCDTKAEAITAWNRRA
jgi:hypothetical protein